MLGGSGEISLFTEESFLDAEYLGLFGLDPNFGLAVDAGGYGLSDSFDLSQPHPSVAAPVQASVTASQQPLSIRVSQGESAQLDPLRSSLVNIVVNPAPPLPQSQTLFFPPARPFAPLQTPVVSAREEKDLGSLQRVEQKNDDSEYESSSSEANQKRTRQRRGAENSSGKVTNALREWARQVIEKEIPTPSRLSDLQQRAIRLERNKKSAQEARNRKKEELKELKAECSELNEKIKIKDEALEQARVKAEVDAYIISNQQNEIEDLKRQLQLSQAEIEVEKTAKVQAIGGMSRFCARLHAMLLSGFGSLGVTRSELDGRNAPQALATLTQQVAQIGEQITSRRQQLQAAKVSRPAVQVDVHLPVSLPNQSFLPLQAQHSAAQAANIKTRAAAVDEKHTLSAKVASKEVKPKY